MKIFFLTFTPLEFSGGFEKYLMKTAHYLSKYPNVDIEIVTIQSKLFTNVVRFILQLYYLQKLDPQLDVRESTEHVRNELKSIKYIKTTTFRELRTYLHDGDLVYVKNEPLDALLLKFVVGYRTLPPVIFSCGTPIVYPDRSTRSRIHNLLYGSFIYKMLTSSVQAFHVKNSNDERALARLGLKVFYNLNSIDKSAVGGIDKVYNIPIPLNLEALSHDVKKFETFHFDNNFVILWTGRLTFQKGIDDLIEVIRLVNKSDCRDKITWVILGDGEEKGKIEELAKAESNVFYYGHVPHEYIPFFIKNSNLFLSTSKWESFGQNILEAQIMDLQAISYDIPGPNEIIIDGKTGFLVHDTPEMIEKIKALARGEVLFADVSKHIEAKFAPEVIYPKLLDLFSNVIHASKTAKK